MSNEVKSEAKKEMKIAPAYQGYVFLGWAAGLFEAKTQTGTEKRPYYNMYVFSPVSDFRSDEYEASGFKAEKKKCISPDVWKGLEPGDKVKLFFDDKQKVIQAALDA